MRDDEFDQILSGEQQIVPSSGFVAVVMDEVRRTAATPPPIAFPWKRALPGFMATVVGFVSILALVFAGMAPPVLPSEQVVIFNSMNLAIVGWLVFALLLTLASMMLSMFLSQRVRDSR